MAKIDVLDQMGKVVDSIELNDEVFGIEPHQQALYDVLVMQAAGKRQGTSKTKGRSEVRGGGRKPYRQKGTGRARQGSIRAPQWVGGGTVFGAVPRDYHYRVNKKIRRLALKSALSAKVADTAFNVVNQFDIKEPKTKTFVSIMEALKSPRKTLFVVGNEEDATNAVLSARNIPGVKMLPARGINVYDLVNASCVVMTSTAVKEVEEALA